jgi:hypothetical protein
MNQDATDHVTGKVSFPHSSADQSQLSLSFCEGDYLHVLCSETHLQLFNVFYAPKKYLQFIKTLMFLCLLRLLYIFIASIS